MRTLKHFDNLERYLEEEEKTERETLRKSRKDLELYQRSFDLCSETITQICAATKRKPLGSTAKEAILFVLPRVMQSMQAIRLLNLRGYYYDASIVERSFIEATGLCAYLALNEEDSERWISGKGIKEAKIKLFEYVPKLLEIKADPEYVGTRALYGQLSAYVHTDPRAITTFVSDWMTEKPPKKIGGKLLGELGIQFTSRFDKEKLRKIGRYPTLMTIMLTVIFENELTKKRSKKIRRLAERLVRASLKEIGKT